MGTNYYLQEDYPCPTCGHKKPDRHIGKSSLGWCFSLHVYPDEGINNLADWLTLFRKHGPTSIVNQYGDWVHPLEMVSIICCRSRDRPPDWAFEMWERKHAEPGPENLIRRRIDGIHCIGNGSGTWDLIVGDFS